VTGHCNRITGKIICYDKLLGILILNSSHSPVASGKGEYLQPLPNLLNVTNKKKMSVALSRK
jgi:hypothetical protein